MFGWLSWRSRFLSGLACFSIPLAEYDERFTSTLAHRAMIDGGMKKKDRRDKAVVDKIAACIILEGYLDSLNGW